ncbi:MAG: asparaginase [Tidjanibacter sp.]|nr:asparaginase [Tidjanibacter sp.]
MKSSVLLIYTGGTIGMRTDPVSGVLVPFDFGHLYEEFPALKELGVDVTILPFDPIDSSNASPELWIHLAEIIRDNYNGFDGFVVLHGTDTMSYSSSALSFLLDGLAKPVVFTGSQIPIGVLRTDGRENLITAIEIAAAKDRQGRAEVPEVALYFQNRLFRANRTTKNSAEELSAFVSNNYPPLAEVGVSIQYNHTAIMHPRTDRNFTIDTLIDRRVAIIKIFPGLTEPVFRAMLSSGVRGVVLETYGSGNAPTYGWFIGALREAIASGLTVVNVTQCSDGEVNMDIYETGVALQQIGVISGKDMTTEAAITKMMCVLARCNDRKHIADAIKRPWRGEISR